MVTLSLCMIVKNEEAFLEKSLQSVQGLVDEIIIVDTGSTDTTKEIARRFTSKVYEFTWCDDFAAARNESLKYATGEWILILDADEVIAREDFVHLKEVIGLNENVGFNLIHRNYTNDVKAAGWVSGQDDRYLESKVANGWWQTPIIRLFKNSKGIKFEGVVHETVDNSLLKNGTIGELNIPIHHYGKLDLQHLHEKNRLYETIGIKKIVNGGDYNSFYELGRQYAENGKLIEAKVVLKQSVDLFGGWGDSWFMLGSVCLMLGHLQDARFSLQQAIMLKRDFAPSYANLGVVCVKERKLEEALIYFGKAVELNPVDAMSYKNMGLCFDELGRKEEAYLAFKKAIELNPKYGKEIKLG